MELTSKAKELITKYGIKMTIKVELTEKAEQLKNSLINDPLIIEFNRIADKLKIH